MKTATILLFLILSAAMVFIGLAAGDGAFLFGLLSVAFACAAIYRVVTE